MHVSCAARSAVRFTLRRWLCGRNFRCSTLECMISTTPNSNSSSDTASHHHELLLHCNLFLFANPVHPLILLEWHAQESGYQATTGSCNAAIAAWRKAGEIEHALAILPYMRLNRVAPTGLTYERLLTTCGDSGLWQVSCAVRAWASAFFGI
jgi:hypothetical protein